jgi:hypothetical protein
MSKAVKFQDIKKMGNRYLLPEQTYNAICIGVFSVGKHENEMYKKIEDRGYFFFEVDHLMPKDSGEYAGKRCTCRIRFNYTLVESSRLYGLLDGWVPFSKVDGEDFIPEHLVGTAGLVTIKHNTKGIGEDMRTYANIVSVVSLPTGMAPLVIENKDYQPPKGILEESNNQLKSD